MREKQLDARLETAISLFPRVRTGADIGADHGYLTEALLKRGIADRMWAVDISASSLQKARKLLGRDGLDDRVRFGVGDGFLPLEEPVEAAAILGMGGRTLSDILRSGAEYLHGAALIVSAHTEIELLRQTLSTLHYGIETERIALVGDQFKGVHRSAFAATPVERGVDDGNGVDGQRVGHRTVLRRFVLACGEHQAIARHE